MQRRANKTDFFSSKVRCRPQLHLNAIKSNFFITRKKTQDSKAVFPVMVSNEILETLLRLMLLGSSINWLLLCHVGEPYVTTELH